jgi:hypothetical protein
MKPVGCFSKLVACAVALGAVLAVCSAQAASGKAVVRVIKGTASYAEQGGEWKPLKTGQSLGPGATVKTAVDGAVVLFLGDNGPDVQLYDSTTLSLDRLSVEHTGAEAVIETQLNLSSGTIKGTVKKLSAASKYEIKTPNAVVGVRGTKYQISANGVVHVIEGSVVVVYINPSTQQMSTHSIGAGQTFVPPLNPAAPGATPTVRPTRADEIIPDVPVGTTGPSGLVVVSQPEPFVSPVHPSP